MEGKHKNYLKYVWLVSATPCGQAGKDKISLEAGALCVSEDGVLATVTHAIRQPDKYRPSIEVRVHGGSFRDAYIIDDTSAGKVFGITLLQVVQREENEKFQHLEISDDSCTSVATGTKVQAYLHDVDFSFNLETGVVCNIPKKVRTPTRVFDSFTFASNPSCPTIGSVATRVNFGARSPCLSDNSSKLNLVGDCVFQTCELLNKSLPFIQVSGLGRTILDGRCGGPVFTRYDNFIGLFFLTTGYHQYVIPLCVVARVLLEYYSVMQAQALEWEGV